MRKWPFTLPDPLIEFAGIETESISTRKLLIKVENVNNVKYPFIAITPRFTLTRSGSPIHGLNRSVRIIPIQTPPGGKSDVWCELRFKSDGVGRNLALISV